MTDTLNTPLGSLTQLSTSLFQSLSSQPHTHGGKSSEPLPPASAFLSAEAALAGALVQTAAHQRRQNYINKLVSDIGQLDSRWREIIAGIEKGRKELEILVREGEERREGIRKAKEGEPLPLRTSSYMEKCPTAAIPYPELLAYAQSISAFTSAPPNMPDPNAPLSTMHGAPVPLFFPPFPNEEKMRRGRLNVEKPLGGLGESHSVKRESYSSLFPLYSTTAYSYFPAPSPSPKPVAAARDRPGVNPYRHEIRTQQLPTTFDLDLDLNPDL